MGDPRPIALGSRLVALALAALSCLGQARGHDFGVSYSRIELSAQAVEIAISINADELPPAVALDDNGDGFIAEAEVLAHDADIRRFFEAQTILTKDERPCRARAGAVRYAPLTTAAETTLRFACPAGPGAVAIELAFVPAFYHPHRNVATVVLGSQERTFLFSAQRSKMTARLVGDEIATAATPAQGPGSLARAGLWSVLGRPDVLALALCFVSASMAAIAALAAGSLGGVLLATAGIIAVQPVALAAALALAVAYLAGDNAIGGGAARGRAAVAAVAGLLQGALAAALLSQRLDPRLLPAAALLAYGAAAAAALAAVALLIRRALATRPWAPGRKLWLTITAIGLWWFAVRAFGFDLPLLPFWGPSIAETAVAAPR